MPGDGRPGRRQARHALTLAAFVEDRIEADVGDEGGTGGEAAHPAELAEEHRGSERPDARQCLQQLGIGQGGVAGARGHAELGFERRVQLIKVIKRSI
jgi:hypothetical protein